MAACISVGEVVGMSGASFLRRGILMFLRSLVAAAFALVVVLTGQATALPTYPIKASSNNKYLVDQTGAPFMIVGDSSQTMIAQLTPAQMTSYFSTRGTQGFNASFQWFICVYGKGVLCEPTVMPTAKDGTPAFTGSLSGGYPDLSKPNEAYFSQLDTMINTAASNGITIFLSESEAGFEAVQTANGATAVNNFGTYLGNRYKNFPNIVWFHGNDYADWGTVSIDNVEVGFINAIKAADPNHIHTIELQPQQLSLDDPRMAGVVHMNAAYSYTTLTANYSEIYRALGQAVIPIFEGETHYENDSDGAISNHDMRAQEYWTVLAGGLGGVFYGNGTITNWPSQNLSTTGAADFGTRFKNFFAAYNWPSLVPDQNHTFVTAGFGSGTSYVTASRAADGSLGMAYTPVATTLTVDMSKMVGPTTVKWFDPTNAAYTTVGTGLSNTGTRTFATPGNNSAGDADWALVMTATPQVVNAAPYTCLRNFYVAVNGTGNGTQASPWGTMQQANDSGMLVGGDCVNVGPGVYPTGSVNLSSGGNSSAQDGNGKLTGFVTYIGAINHGSIIRSNAAASFLIGQNSNYLIVDGFDIDGNNQLGSGANGGGGGYLVFSNGNHHEMVLNSLVHDIGNGGGIAAVNSEYYIFSGNIVYNNGSAWDTGISVWRPYNCNCAQNTPFDNQHFHIQFTDNIVYNQGKVYGGPHGEHSDGNGLSFDDFFHQNGGGDNVHYPFYSLQQGNVAYNNGGNCLNDLNGGHFDIENNTCYNNGQDAQNTVPDRGEIIFFQSTDAIVRNNATYAVPNNGGGATSANTGITVGNVDTNMTIDHNIFFGGNGGGSHGNCGPSVDADTNWCSGILANNLANNDPKFVSLSLPDFHLQTTSPGIGNGATPPTGYPPSTPDHMLQPSPPNRGAYNVTGAGGGSATLTANPQSIVAPASSTLTWSSTGTTSCTGTGFSTGSATSGTASVTPTTTTTYSVSCTGTGGTFTANTTVTVTSGTGALKVNSGGPAADPFIADTAFTGGFTTGNGNGTTDVTGVTNPAPQAVYQTERYGTGSPAFNYTFNGLTPNASYKVRLHFTEDWPADNSAGARKVTVNMNGVQVLAPFDIFAATGALHKAIVKDFTQAANGSGVISIDFIGCSTCSDTYAKVDGVEVALAAGSATLSANPTSIVSGNSSTLTWGSSGATSCTGTGFSTANATSGTAVVTPTATTTYSVSCAGTGGPFTANAVVTVTPGTGAIAINAGGIAAAPFVADTAFNGGATTTNGNGTTDVTAVTNPAPQAVYQTERYGSPFGYTYTGLIPNASYLVRLHFSEDWAGDNAAGRRLIGININGPSVLSNFDIFATAGALHKAVIKEFTVNADNTGTIGITFTGCSTCTDTNAKVDGLEVKVPAAQTLGALTPSATSFHTCAAVGTVIGTINGTTPGSTVTITGQSTSNALQVAKVGSAWQLQVGPGALCGPNTFTFSLVETLAGATNSPRTTSGLSETQTCP
jgi:uncharacterized protein DUF4038/malectin (di-glucose binding ER protein)/collagenase-like protein with putative collagen-binding domain